MSTEAELKNRYPQGGQKGAPRAGVLLAFMFAATAGMYWAVLSGMRAPLQDHWGLAPLIALGAWAGGARQVSFQNRGAAYSLALNGMPVVAGIILLRPSAALASVAAGYGLAQAQSKRSVLKKSFNVLALLLSVSAAAIAYQAALGHLSPVGLWGWACIAAAMAVLDLVSLAAVLAYMAWNGNDLAAPPLSVTAAQLGLDIAVNSVGAIVVVSLASVSSWTIGLLALFTAGGIVGWRRAMAASQRHATLEKVYGFAQALAAAQSGEHDVVTKVLEEARSLLSASRAVLVAPLSAPLEHLALSCRLDGEQPVQFEEAVPLGRLAEMVRYHGGFLLSPSGPGPDVQEARELAGVNDGVVVPLRSGEAGVGYLVVADRPFTHEGFGDDDLTLLSALAANAEVALRRSGLLDKLRHEAAVRHHEAYHDSLTGLPNRAQFSERLAKLLKYAPPGVWVGVILADLDGFKQVNDTLGHNVGDAVLTEVARRLAPFGGEGRLVARLGGDEFVVLLEDAPEDSGCIQVAEQVAASLVEPITASELDLSVKASVGVAVAIAGLTTATRLLRHAEIAMYKAKAEGGGVRMYDAATDRSTLRRLSLATELRKAVEGGGLQLYYQPVLDVATGNVISCEALSRWKHERFGLVPPDEFIPVAEKAGLIDPLTWWAMETALAQVKLWRRVLPGLSVAVNLSARSLMTPNLAGRVEDVLARAGLGPEALHLELTESSMMSELGEQAVRALSRTGVALSIDDFGMGYSSLTRLRHLPFDEVKIDRSFVTHMVHVGEDEAVVRSVIELARGLGKVATAEGVEDKATLRRLADMGCHAAQGFYLARPLPAEECATLLVAQARWPSTVADLPAGGPA